MSITIPYGRENHLVATSLSALIGWQNPSGIQDNGYLPPPALFHTRTFSIGFRMAVNSEPPFAVDLFSPIYFRLAVASYYYKK